MTKPDTIPQDVWDTAKLVRRVVGSAERKKDEHCAVAYIAVALMAERDRKTDS